MRSAVKITVLMVILSIFTTCRKGPDDPLVSLRTRKARLAGEWRLQSGNMRVTYVDIGNFARMNVAYKVNGGRYEGTETGLQGSFSGTYVLSLKIEKDGTFSLHEVFDTNELNVAGIWDFALASKNVKRKEEFFLLIEKVTKGSTNNYQLFNWGSTNMRYMIRELRHKKLVLTVSSRVLIDPDELNIDYSGDLVFTQD